MVDQHKNFAYIANEKLHFHFSEREPLVEYSADGQPTRSHQGFVLVVKSVRGLGKSEGLHLIS